MTALTQSHSELIRRHGEERRRAENSGKSGNLFRASQLWEMAEEREKRGEQRETERDRERRGVAGQLAILPVCLHCNALHSESPTEGNPAARHCHDTGTALHENPVIFHA